MKTFDVSCPPRGLVLGYAGENIARGQAFDFTAWAEEYGAGSLQVALQRPGDAVPYPVALTVEGTVATWLPTETDLQEAGTGQLQLIYTVGTVRVKTLIVSVLIGPSLGSSGEVPEPAQAWLDQLTDLAAETEQHASSAAESAAQAKEAASHYPKIVDGVWYVWSPTAGEYISTGIDAQGEDGVSPTVEITAIQGGHRVVITDADGPHTFDVLDGVTPDMSAYRTAADQDVIDDAQDEELNHLKSAIGTLTPTATASDVGKFLKAKTVEGGKVTEYEFGSGGGGSGGAVDDVQINGQSIVQDGVANVPIASDNTMSPGLVGIGGGLYGYYGLKMNGNQLRLSVPNDNAIKTGAGGSLSITTYIQHKSAFYALAKAAGDTTQSQSANAVGNYTESAKSAISEMLNGSVSVSGTTPSITALPGVRYVCGEVSTLDITLPASGIVDVTFTSGSTATVLTITPPTGVTLKWANGFDPTALEANTTYEINIMDGLGLVANWEVSA